MTVQRRQDDVENNVILTPAWDSRAEILGEKNSESQIKHTVYLANIESYDRDIIVSKAALRHFFKLKQICCILRLKSCWTLQGSVSSTEHPE